MAGLADTIAELASRRGTTVRTGTSGEDGTVLVAGAAITPSRWINDPGTAGEPVVLLLGSDMSVAVGTGRDHLLRGGDIMTGPLFLDGSLPLLARTAVDKEYVDGKMGEGLAVPRWRGLLPNKVQATGATESKWTGAPTVYSADRVTISNGTITFAESGIYTIGGSVRCNQQPTAELRMLLTWWRNSAAGPRMAFARSEDRMGYTFVDGVNAGATAEFRVYQNVGATATFTNMYVNIVKIADL